MFFKIFWSFFIVLIVVFFFFLWIGGLYLFKFFINEKYFGGFGCFVNKVDIKLFFLLYWNV